MDIGQIKDNKLKMILQFSLPSIIAMLLQTVITITDGYFTGNYVGENALAAINLGLPILYFYLGVGLCVGVGGSVICGRLLGAKEKQKLSEVFSQTIVTAVLVCISISVLVFALFTSILGILRADGDLVSYFTEYYRIMLFNYPLMVVGTVLGMFIRVDGKPQICMIVSIVGCIFNVILDYILVGKMGLGVQGSAIGSLMVQIVTVVVYLGYFISRKARIRFSRFRFDKVINREIICTGFGQGITPLISICWGAKEIKVAIDIRKITNKILFVIGIIIAFIFIINGRIYASLFGCSSNVADMVSTGFKLYAATFLVMGYDVINSMYFTSCGDAKSSAIISALRGIVLLLGFTFILSAILGMNGVWLAAPCSEIITSIVSVYLIRRQKIKLKEVN